ncbi:MAG: photosynthetic protein synthase I [Alteromonadaceae bacterium]|nr:MAG: photosynthetic protein synthase I [Alteromonadaceae bacterium]
MLEKIWATTVAPVNSVKGADFAMSFTNKKYFSLRSFVTTGIRTKAIMVLACALPFGVQASKKHDNASYQLTPVTYKQPLAKLGKRLFFDNRLSGDVSFSCASCHIPSKGFSDGLSLSDAYGPLEGFRNTPTLINVASKSIWFHDGRMGTNLNDVVRDQLTDAIWMNMDMRIMQERSKQDPVYVEMFKQTLGQEPTNGGIRKALAEYLKSLQSKNVAFDQGELSAQAKSGWQLFKGEGNCTSCHSGSLFTDEKAYNIGVAEAPEIYNEPARSAAFIAFNMFMGNENYMNLRADPGASVQHHRYNADDFSSFITPTLRELKYTAPYMHNGSAESLKDAVNLHFSGKRISSLKNVSLSEEQVNNLVVFLEALSGDPLTGNDVVWPEDKPIRRSYPVIPDWQNVSN